MITHNGVAYLTVEETGMMLDCSTATVWRRVKQGKLRPFKVLSRSLFRKSDVDMLMVPSRG